MHSLHPKLYVFVMCMFNIEYNYKEVKFAQYQNILHLIVSLAFWYLKRFGVYVYFRQHTLLMVLPLYEPMYL